MLNPNRKVALVLVPLLCLLTACNARQHGPNLSQPIDTLLPADWKHTGAWYDVDMDDDGTNEYLLFITYDGIAISGSSQAQIGPIGALMLDTAPRPPAPTVETVSDTVTVTVAADDQTLTPDEVRLYRVLPGYWPGQGQGFIAGPGEEGNIIVTPVTSIVSDPAGRVPNATLKEIAIFAGDTRMTVIWLRSPELGYGVTQVYGPGGLLRLADEPEFANIVEPITTLWADTPLNDRNMLCLRSRYDRVIRLAEPPALPFSNFDAVSYIESPEGIKFCHGAPRHPYYPEGVVLAYMENPQAQEHLLFPDLSLDSKTTVANTVQALWSGDTPPRVDALLGYQWWPPVLVEGQAYIETAVCTTVESLTGPQSLLFRLLHGVEAGADGHMGGDRLFIQNVSPLPAPTGAVAADCRTVIGGQDAGQREAP
ncbi:MAG: hypothetical protein R3A44_34835 [Caldilineaceae bacterium]